MKFDIKKRDSRKHAKKYTFELSRTGLIGMGAALLLGLVWVFIFGVLIGRGYSPEKDLPKLASIMPSPPEEQGPAPNPEVLKAEELQFMDNLRDTPPAGPVPATEATAPEAASQSETAPAETAPPVETANRVETASVENLPERKPDKPLEKKTATAPKPETAPVEPAAEQAPSDPDTRQYDYIYQVASFRDKVSGMRFQEKVEKLGLKATVDKAVSDGSVWYRVNVHFRGKPEDTREMKAKLNTIGVPKPLMRSKTPI